MVYKTLRETIHFEISRTDDGFLSPYTALAVNSKQRLQAKKFQYLL